MRRILIVALAAASVLAFPTFAQVIPNATGTSAAGSAHAGVSATGAPSNTGVGSSADASAGTDADSTSNLGLGGLLRQTQSSEAPTGLDGDAGMSSSTEAKALVKKARAHGH